MATITVQRGHCFRKRGATGTHREQEFSNAIGTALAGALRAHGHVVHLIGADDAVPRADAFIALHTDGSSNRARRGASVGYPDAKGAVLARAWKEAHTRAGYPGGWLPDNYTAALRGYYGFGKAKGTPYRFLAEHAMTTNREDERWLESSLGTVVAAHVEAIGKVLGHPVGNAMVPARPRILGHGDEGADVTQLQELLNAWGYGLTEDGIFGDATAVALRDFQHRQALLVDGLAGPQTMESLLDHDIDGWVIGAIREKWLAGRQAGKTDLGDPRTRELKLPDGRGRVSHFEHGSIYWTPEHGAWVLRGELRHVWDQNSGALGYPVSDEQDVEGHPDGWVIRQDFEHGILYWRPGVVWLYREIWRA